MEKNRIKEEGRDKAVRKNAMVVISLDNVSPVNRKWRRTRCTDSLLLLVFQSLMTFYNYNGR